MTRRWFLSPAAVARRRRCSTTAVKEAIWRGELPAIALRGPDGKVSAYAVRVADADRWVPRDVGRPPQE